MTFLHARNHRAFRSSAGSTRVAALILGAAVFLTGCSSVVVKTGGASPTTTAPTVACPSPEPTVTVTETAGVEPSASTTGSAPAVACPTVTETVTVALYRSGEGCKKAGEKYLAVEPALLCFKDKAGKALWMTAAQVRQTQAEIAKAKAVAEVARKKAQEAARQKAAAAELEKAAAEAARQAAAEAQKAQAPAEQTPRRFVPEVPQNNPAPADPGSVYYANCAAVRAAGAAPIRIGQPGYSPKLDRDGDGVGCE